MLAVEPAQPNDQHVAEVDGQDDDAGYRAAWPADRRRHHPRGINAMPKPI